MKNGKSILANGPFNFGCAISKISEEFIFGMDNSVWETNLKSDFIDYYSPLQFNILEVNPFAKNNVIEVSCGDEFSIILCDNHSVWSFGYNQYGQLGLGDTLNRTEFVQIETNEKFVSISCGYNHSMFLGSNQRVFFSGLPKHLHLGISKRDTLTPFLINDLFFISLISCQKNKSFCVDTNGKLFVFGQKTKLMASPIWKPKLPPIEYISSGLGADFVAQDFNGDTWILTETATQFEKLNHPEILVGKSNEQCFIELCNDFRIQYVKSIFYYYFFADFIYSSFLVGSFSRSSF